MRVAASTAMRRLVAALGAAVLVTGCVANTYKITDRELVRLSQMPPEVRGQSVRVVQDITEANVPPAQPVTAETRIVVEEPGSIGLNINGGGGGGSYRGGHGGGGHSLGGGSGGDGKGLAIVVLVVAAVALVAVAAVEGSRFDGWAQLHPMHPVHLIGKDGSYAILPLAWIDPQTAAWADHAVVRDTEGPWRDIQRAPLSRQGWTYGMYGGLGSLRSAAGDVAFGPTFTVQAGYFPEHRLGVVAGMNFGWRDNTVGETLFEARYTLELQGFPIQLGRLHGGLYGGAGASTRLEDGFVGGNSSTLAFTGGATFQLDLDTRIALTGRLGIVQAHDEHMSDAMIGISVY
jgi:hypothetical protein